LFQISKSVYAALAIVQVMYGSLLMEGDRLRRRIGRADLLYLERAPKAREIINRCTPAVAYIIAALTSMQRRWRGHLQKPKAVELYHGLFCAVGGMRGQVV
jgi:hypothetical protein